MASSTSQSPATLRQPRYARPLRGEGASAAEAAIEAAMRSSSPMEEPCLGKRVRKEDDSLIDHNDSESDGDSGSLQPSLIASTLHFASRKKLRPEQRDEVEAFLSVSHWRLLANALLKNLLGYSAWSSGQTVCVYSVNRKQD